MYKEMKFSYDNIIVASYSGTFYEATTCSVSIVPNKD